MTARRLLPLLLGLLALAGCGGDDEAADATTAAAPVTAAAPERRPAPVRIGLVTAVGGLDDRSFGALADRGLEQAKRELGVEGRVAVSRAPADDASSLSSFAQQDFDLVIAVGSRMADAVETVAARFPEIRFAIVDVSQAALRSKPRNVRGLLFAEQEAGYLAGYLAALVTKEEGGAKQVIGSVGGASVPSVDRYIAGYRAGARRANPRIALLNQYSQTFDDPAKCKELALDQIARGAHVVFQVAGRCGLGVLSAAREKNVRAIGVDADQGYLGPYVLTSAVKKVDVAVFQTIRDVRSGRFSGGEDTIFDVASGGVGIGEIAPDVPAEAVAAVKRIQDELASGKIAAIPETLG